MLTSGQIRNLLFRTLNAKLSDLRAAGLDGDIYQQRRPDNSTKTDIVITDLSWNYDTPQTGTFNINVHVPDKSGKSVDGQPQKTPQTAKLTTLTCCVRDAVEGASEVGIDYYIENDALIETPKVGDTYNNIRVQVINYNTELTTI